MTTVINASAAVTLLEQRPESRSEPEIFSGLCSSSVTAALALNLPNRISRFHLLLMLVYVL